MSEIFESIFNLKLIYIFEIRDDAHKGLLKIGDATIETKTKIKDLRPNCAELNKAAKKRIDEYTRTAAIKYELLHTELAIKNDEDKNLKAFRDYDVHNVLKNSGIQKVKFGDSNGKEWFQIDLKTAISAIKAVKDGWNNLSSIKIDTRTPIDFRPEQEKAIKNTIAQFKEHNNMLWNAKMRFGKTLSALEVVRLMKFKRTIIMTHRPVVDDGWYDDFGKIFFREEDKYVYGSRSRGDTIASLEKKKVNFVYFASIQDLRGSARAGGKFDKNDDVFDTEWDFVIVDEAHEGTQTALGEDVIKHIVKKNSKFLALSGTPFNILGNYEDDAIYTWDYIMEQRAKLNWSKEHFGDSNPYENLPSMSIYTYNLGQLLSTNAYVELEDKAFNFREFFRVNDNGSFCYESDIKKFLDLITKKDEKSNYPYSKEEYRDLFQHTLWMVPGVKEAQALKELMKKHPIFGNGLFHIINVAGNDGEEASNALVSVKNAINDCPDGECTITLSCGKLTTGVTIPEWTAVFMLAGSFSTSAANYLQTIFRVQSPCNKNGMIKEKCYVFDFAPDRTLKMVAEAVTVSGKAGKTDKKDKEILREFLNFCPVISFSGTEMKKYNQDVLLQQLKRAYAERAVENGFDDNNLYNQELLKLDELDIEKFNNLKNIVGTSKSTGNTKEIDINDQGFTDEEYEKIKQAQKKPKKDLTEEERQLLEEARKKKDSRNKAISILRQISIRMPLLIYGLDIPIDDDVTMEKLINKVDDDSWNEFMPSGVTKDLFQQFIKYYDEDIFVQASRRIRNIVYGADKLPITDRIKQITTLFKKFKNPDKETVLTPWRVVNMHLGDCLGGYDFYDEEHKELCDNDPRFIDNGVVTSETLAKANAKILEINSKTGVYPLYVAYSIFKTKCKAFKKEELTEELQNKLWKDTIQNNIFVICKTKMAKYITKRTLVGYNNININAHYFQDLINQMSNKQKQFKEKVLSNKYWNKEDKGYITFDAVVGNPPYQETIGGDGNKSLSKQLFPYFVEGAVALSNKYVSLITPSRWFSGKAQDGSFIKLRDFAKNNNHFEKIFYYRDDKDVFPGVDIGSVNYFLYNKEYNGLVEFSEIIKDKRLIKKRPLFEDGVDYIISMNDIVSILEKVKNRKDFISFDTITAGRNAYGVMGKKEELDKISSSEYFEGSLKVYCAHEEVRYIEKEKVTKNRESIKSWKVISSKANGGAGLLTDDKKVAIIGKSFVAEPDSICTDSLLPFGQFKTQKEALNLQKYMSTKFLRFMVGILKVSQNIYQIVYQFVPLQDFTDTSDIDWNMSIHDIDKQLYKKYGFTEEEIEFIESKIKSME